MLEERLREAARHVAQERDLDLVVLFGSAARHGLAHAADLDLGVIGRGPVDLVALTSRLVELLGVQAIDLVDLRLADALLLALAARDGVVLHEGCPARSRRSPRSRRAGSPTRASSATLSARRSPTLCAKPRRANDQPLMTDLDRALVRRKLATVVRNVRDLATVAELSLAEYQRDRFRQRGSSGCSRKRSTRRSTRTYTYSARPATTRPPTTMEPSWRRGGAA